MSMQFLLKMLRFLAHVVLCSVHKDLDWALVTKRKRDIYMRTKQACSTIDFDPD